jgi:hypothetical protein
MMRPICSTWIRPRLSSARTSGPLSDYWH